MVSSTSESSPPLKIPSVRSSPIACPVPRRKSYHPPPCSPPGDQNSPEFVFNLDFSVSPDAPAMMSTMYLQNQGASTRLFPLQQKAAAFLPLSALGNGHSGPAHPYASEPFLYSVPKAPFRDTQNTYRDSHSSFVADETSQVHHGAHSALVNPSPTKSSAPCLPFTLRASADHMERDEEEQALTGAFREPLASSPPSSSWGAENLKSRSSVYRSPSPPPPRMRSPPRRVYSGGRPRQLLLTPSRALQRTAAATPVVSLNNAQAERPEYSTHRHLPYPINTAPRVRRLSTSTASSGRSAENPRERTRRMSTVVGRGAGRVVTRSTSGMSLVSDEDIERSLEMEKDEAEVVVFSRGRSISRRRLDDSLELLAEKDSKKEASPERGRARGRVPLRRPAA